MTITVPCALTLKAPEKALSCCWTQDRALGAAKPSEAKWTQGEGNAVTFSGAVEFPIGNVGRDAGTLVFKGKFETPDLITGEVDFSPLVGDRPSKSGTFKASPRKVAQA